MYNIIFVKRSLVKNDTILNSTDVFGDVIYNFFKEEFTNTPKKYYGTWGFFDLFLYILKARICPREGQKRICGIKALFVEPDGTLQYPEQYICIHVLIQIFYIFIMEQYNCKQPFTRSRICFKYKFNVEQSTAISLLWRWQKEYKGFCILPIYDRLLRSIRSPTCPKEVLCRLQYGFTVPYLPFRAQRQFSQNHPHRWQNVQMKEISSLYPPFYTQKYVLYNYDVCTIS